MNPNCSRDPVFGVIGFNVDTWMYHNLKVTSWDLGGQDKIRILWRHYYPGLKGLIFVVDSNDRDRLPEARDELNLLLAEAHLDGIPLLVLANKQDLPRCMPATEISETLELEGLFPRPWRICPVCSVTSEGLHEAFDWLRSVCRTGDVSKKTLPGLKYFPGDYVVHTRLQILETPQSPPLPNERKSSKSLGFLETGTAIHISEIHTVGQRHYGFLREPTEGWVFIGTHGAGEHVRQRDFVVTLSCLHAEGSSPLIQCTTLGGDELATLEVDESFQTVAQFRANLGARLGRQGTSLKIVMPSGALLPRSGSHETLFEALTLQPLDLPSVNCKERHVGCLVQ
eukprot:TRINITY_DN19003_c0_g1_i1.p1 TRINITY_DN19003_c0_g1~~TRINITY_DN19003_c0_g1_i1.p1  ORF type:complete len:340 (-),score=41.96 TRINITY_DN19003_c0_g1_i1:39-1058(-)